MKKKYISPVATVIEFDGEALMYEATSTEYTDNVFSGRKEFESDGWDSSIWSGMEESEEE